MAVDQRTSNYRFEKPYADNKLIEDVERLRRALDSIDAQFKKLAQVAWSGSYNDLKDKVSQVQTDWNATSGLAQIKNRPNLATVATTGQYNDLLNKPDISTMIANAILAKVPKSVGSAVKGVYTNANGVVSPMTYELRKTVPADAVFTDYRVQTIATNPSSGTWYDIPFCSVDPATGTLGINEGIRLYSLQGTSSTEGHAYLQTGNSTVRGTAGNKTGHFRMYGPNKGYAQLDYANSASNSIHTFPATNGTVLNTGTTSFAQALKSGVEIGSLKINGTTQKLYCRDTVTTVTTSGSGNAITSLTASNGALTAKKDSSFSLSNHSHGGLLYAMGTKKGTNPTGNLFHELISHDNSNAGTSAAYRFAMVGRSLDTSGMTAAYLTAYDSTAGSTKSATVGVYYPKGGTPYATAPATRTSGTASTEIITYGFLSSRYLPTAGGDMLGRLNLYRTADVGDSSLQAASTEFVQTAIASALRNICELVWSIFPLSDSGLHLLDGAVLTQSGVYSDFVKYIASKFNEARPTAVYIPCKRIVLPEFSSNKENGITISDARSNTTVLQAIFNGSNRYNAIGKWETYWINIDYAQNTLLDSYTIQADNDGNPEYPSAWTLRGSNDGASWTTIDTRSGISFKLNESKTFSVSPATAYRQYRIVFSAGVHASNNGQLHKVSFAAHTAVSGYRNCAFATEAQWQAFVSAYGSCGKFVYNSTAKTVRLPKVSDILQGTTNVNAVGELVEAGLPNITGSHRYGGYYDGAFYSEGSYGGGWDSDGSTNLTRFDASRCSPIYGNSNTVQPQAIRGLLYIVIANKSKTQVEVNINSVISDLNAKLDKSGGTITGTINSSLSCAIINSRASGDTYCCRAARTDTGHSISVGIGSAGVNRGIYDHTRGVWIVYANADSALINANNGSTNKQLKAGADGNLSWGGTTIHTSSDERLKTPLETISDNELDAWGDVEWGQFQFREAVAEKGESARWHIGLIAQRVSEAFEKRGLDACRFGILCHETRPAEFDENGNETIPAFEQWMVRYDEAHAMETIYQRRRVGQIEAENTALKQRVSDLENRLAAIEERILH